jgi:hypothetical protein
LKVDGCTHADSAKCLPGLLRRLDNALSVSIRTWTAEIDSALFSTRRVTIYAGEYAGVIVPDAQSGKNKLLFRPEDGSVNLT